MLLDVSNIPEADNKTRLDTITWWVTIQPLNLPSVCHALECITHMSLASETVLSIHPLDTRAGCIGHALLTVSLICRHFQQAAFSNFEVLEKQADNLSVTLGTATMQHVKIEHVPSMFLLQMSMLLLCHNSSGTVQSASTFMLLQLQIQPISMGYSLQTRTFDLLPLLLQVMLLMRLAPTY